MFLIKVKELITCLELTHIMLLIAVDAEESSMSSGVGKTLQAAGLTHGPVTSIPKEKTLYNECRDSSRGGHADTGFVSSGVPTLEEETVMEQRPVRVQDNSNDLLAVRDEIPDEEADEIRQRESHPRGSRINILGDSLHAGQPDDSDEPPRHTQVNEEAAPEAGSKFRNTPNHGVQPTRRPVVDPNNFEDPICDKFWKDVWVASAVHNVNAFNLYLLIILLNMPIVDRNFS